MAMRLAVVERRGDGWTSVGARLLRAYHSVWISVADLGRTTTGRIDMRILVIAALSVAAAAIGRAQPPVSPATKTVMLKGAGGASAGTATLTDAPKGVLLHVEASGLTPGWHAIHFHEKGDCSDTAFKMAGGHVHAMGTMPSVHGLLVAAATDQGDLPNIHAAADGGAIAEIFAPMVALHAGTDRANLLDTDGSAIVIHAMKDDYASQPIGGAGARVACGVIR